MCDHCGCSTIPAHDHEHGHDHGHHHHDHDHGAPGHHKTVPVQQSILAQNDRLAEQNRGMFRAHHIAVVNLVSSPGSGKTAILERTLQDLAGRFRMAVIVGDLATDRDAKRLRRFGVPAVQITTGTACHLDAHMVQHALETLDLEHMDILFIENVGNLVCPASFDLGEDQRVVVTSVTEGEDKPLKYPVIFQGVQVVLMNKIDLAEAAEFNRAEAHAHVRQVAPASHLFEVSAKTGTGMTSWYSHLEQLIASKQNVAAR